MQHRQGKPLAGLAPVGVGSAKWEAELLSGWQQALKDRFPNLRLLAPERPILPALPSARQLVRGQWVGGPFPERFAPTFTALANALFAHSSQNEGADAAASAYAAA